MKRSIPKLILLNIIFPDISGYEICKRIKIHPKYEEVPVFLFTAIPRSEVEKKMEEVGADGYILKPFSFSEFDDVLRILEEEGKRRDEIITSLRKKQRQEYEIGRAEREKARERLLKIKRLDRIKQRKKKLEIFEP